MLGVFDNISMAYRNLPNIGGGSGSKVKSGTME